MKKTLVVGASPNPDKYSYKATMMLNEYNHPVVAFGIKKGKIESQKIINELPTDKDFDTVTLYLNPQNQEMYIDYILNLKPKRVVFNPGTENPKFKKMLLEKGVKALEACTLVLLRTGQY